MLVSRNEDDFGDSNDDDVDDTETESHGNQSSSVAPFGFLF